MEEAKTGAPRAPKTSGSEESSGKAKPAKKKAKRKLRVEPEPKQKPNGAKETESLFGKQVPEEDYDEAARALHHELRKLGMVGKKDDVPLSSASTEHFERVYDLVDEVLYSIGIRTTKG